MKSSIFGYVGDRAVSQEDRGHIRWLGQGQATPARGHPGALEKEVQTGCRKEDVTAEQPRAARRLPRGVCVTGT